MKNVIVATSISSLYSCCIILLKLGATNILLEKPGALSINELKKIKKLSNQKKSNVHIAYNRRFYKSVIELEKKINKNESILSCFIDFTEI